MLSWLLAIGTAAGYLYFSWHHFDDPDHPDGNRGHTYIDFGGQYLLGRMVIRSQGQHLYHRPYQRTVLEEAYPRQNESPDQERSDAQTLMNWFMGQEAEDATPSGPLYPPIQAFWFSALALLPPQAAYRSLQIVIVLGAFTAGLGLTLLSGRRLWWPLASVAVMLFPGFASSLSLGQNSIFSLNILIWGWVCICRDRPVWGGMIWGLLAFKPDWAAAFFLVPLWMGRWRACVAMLASGLGQILLTLPVVGWHSWIDWLEIVRQAIRVAQVDEIWITRSRDLFTLPRRWLALNASGADWHMDQTATLVSAGLWLAVVGMTTGMVLWWKGCSESAECGVRNAESSAVGALQCDSALRIPNSAFLFLGAWLSCVHAMYYDVLLAALPIFLLYFGPKLPPRSCHALVAILLLAPATPALGLGEPPMETVCLFGLWVLCGWRWARRNSAIEPRTQEPRAQ